MSRFARSFGLTFILCASLHVFSQLQVAPPQRPQTARQALIEMLTKGGNAIEKHLTVEVQELLESSGKASPLNSYGTYMKLGAGLESFDSGDVLLAFYPDQSKTTKYEIHVDSDDLSGDEDTLLLSVHTFREGTEKEQESEFGLLSSHFSVSMKLQQNVWRLNKVSVGADFPIGDPEFIKKTLLKTSQAASATTGGALYTPQATTQLELRSGSSEGEMPALPPQQTISLLGMAEHSFARMHPKTGFTCSLKDLAETSKAMGVNEQVNTGTYNGYRFALSGCESTPAGSYQIVAEPLTLEKGSKSFCADPTGNVRFSDDGRGATCLASGKLLGEALEEGGGMTGFDAIEIKPENQQ